MNGKGKETPMERNQVKDINLLVWLLYSHSLFKTASSFLLLFSCSSSSLFKTRTADNDHQVAMRFENISSDAFAFPAFYSPKKENKSSIQCSGEWGEEDRWNAGEVQWITNMQQVLSRDFLSAIIELWASMDAVAILSTLVLWYPYNPLSPPLNIVSVWTIRYVQPAIEQNQK